MGFFGKLVKTAVNVAVLPVAVARDVVMAPVIAAKAGSDPWNPLDLATRRQLEKIKDEADD